MLRLDSGFKAIKLTKQQTHSRHPINAYSFPAFCALVLILVTCVLPAALMAQTSGTTAKPENPDLPLLTALRARVIGGAIFSNSPAVVASSTNANGQVTTSISSDQFGKAELFLSFESQPRVWAINTSKTDCPPRFYIDPILNVRSTSIGVETTSVFNNESLIVAPTGKFIKDQKAVQLHFGGVAGYALSPFDLGIQRFHWAFEGIGRAMLQSVTDQQRAARIWNLRDDLYDAHTFGGRLALYQYEKDKSWKPAAYIEFSRGRFQNYETATGRTEAAQKCLNDPRSCLAAPPPQSDYIVTKPWRTYIEGRIFLRNVFAGFDINNGNGRDDVRFLAGLYVDFDRFFSLK